jgi:hypothetical protein
MITQISLQQHRKTLLSEGMNATFEFPLRFSKSYVGEYTNDTGEKKHGKIIEGIASTEDKDQQGEIVMQDKMDCSYLLEKGYLNWNHSHSPEDQIGKPLEVIKMEGGPTTPNGKPCTFFRALLFDGVPRADAVWQLAKALSDTQGVGNDRSLGFSVEGGVRMRQGHMLVETVVRHMAATHEPVNAQSVARCVVAKSQGFKVHDSVLVDVIDNNVPHFIFKSFGHLVQSIEPNIRKTIGLGDIGALKKEYLASSRDKKTSPEYILSKLYTECKDGRNCKKNDRFVFGKRGALDHLVHCANMDPNEAADILALALKILH